MTDSSTDLKTQGSHDVSDTSDKVSNIKNNLNGQENNVENINETSAEGAESDDIDFPMLRSRRRKRESLKKTRSQKEDDAQSSLVSKIQSMLKEARYELEIDAYRGIFDETESNTFIQCSQIFPTSADEGIEDIYSGIRCPCVKSWIQQERQNHKKAAFKGRGQNKRSRNGNNRNVDQVDQETSDANISDNRIFKLNRRSDSSFQCPCDFNPLCTLSLGGAVDDFLYHTLHQLKSHRNGFCKPTTVDNQVGNISSFEEDDISNSISSNQQSSKENTSSMKSKFSQESYDNAHSFKNTKVPSSITSPNKNLNGNLIIHKRFPSNGFNGQENLNKKVEMYPYDQTNISDSDNENISAKNCNINAISNATNMYDKSTYDLTLFPTTLRRYPESSTTSQSQDQFLDLEKSDSTICSKPSKSDKNQINLLVKSFVVQNKRNMLSEKPERIESINAGDIFLKYSRTQIIELVNQMQSRHQTTVCETNDKMSKISFNETYNLDFSKVRQSTWVNQKSIEKYLRDMAFQCDSSHLESDRNHVDLNIDKCLGIIRSWNKHLTYAVPNFNGELIEHFKAWLPFSLSGLETLDPSKIQIEKNWDYTVERCIKLAMPPGMKNLGATCYLNSQFQVLAQNPVFSLGVFSWNMTPDEDTEHLNRMNKVLYSMQLILSRMIFGANNVVSTDEFSNALGLENGEMQDPNEFTRLLFDRIHESFQQSSFSSTASKNAEMNDTKNSLGDLLPRLFQGICVYETTCLECKNKSVRKEKFMDLTLPLSECERKKDVTKSNTTPSKESDEISVQSCLDVYLKPEILDAENRYHCEQCNSKCKARRNVSFSVLPPVLNIQLARYVFDRKELMKRKLVNRVLLPKLLRVPEKRKDRSSKMSNFKAENNSEYILCAVQNHKGKSAYGGHYVAEAMDWTTGVWYEYNDEEVTLLPNGPNSSYDSDLVDQGMPLIDANDIMDNESAHSNNPFNESTGKNNKPRGSRHAYNLYYVEKTFLAKCAKQQLLEFHKQIKMLKTSYTSNDSLGTQYDSISKVSKERIDTYKLMSQVFTNRFKSAERLLRRKAGIFHFLLPHLVKTSQFFSIPDLNPERDTYITQGKIISDEKIWVEGLLLRRFLSCSDEMDDIFCLDTNKTIFSNKKWLCEHGEGLHPRIARKGKLLHREAYNVLVSLMHAEKEYIRCSKSSDNKHVQKVTDCLITTKNNLYCSKCVEKYRRILQKKVIAIEALLSLQEDLNSASFDIDFNESSENNDRQSYFAVSRNFLTSFKKYSQRKMKESVGLNIQLDNGIKGSWVSSSEGIDKLDLSDILPENDHSHDHVNLVKVGNNDKCNEKETLDPFVNSNITCSHGNITNSNKRSIRIVPERVWEKIKYLFPRAISVPYRGENSKQKTDFCKLCTEEKERMYELEQSLHLWASEIMSDNIAEANTQEKNDNNYLRKFHLRTTSKSSCSEKKYATSEREFRVVNHLDVSAWNFVIQTILSKKGSKGNKGSKSEDFVSKLVKFLFNTQQDTTQSAKAEHVIDDSKGATSMNDHSKVFMKINSLHNIRWNMHSLVCEKHQRITGAPQLLVDSYNLNNSGVSNGCCSLSAYNTGTQKTSRTSEQSMESYWELLTPTEYSGFISSINKLCAIFESVTDILPPPNDKDTINATFDCHPKFTFVNRSKYRTDPLYIEEKSSTSFVFENEDISLKIECEPQLCVNEECIKAFPYKESLYDCKVLNSILSPDIEKNVGNDDEVTLSINKSNLDIQHSVHIFKVMVYEFDDKASLSEMCDYVSEKLFPQKPLFNYNGIRRSTRKRRRTSMNLNCKDILEILFDKNGNLAKLRLMIAERTQNIGLVKQQLYILLKITKIDVKTNISSDNVGNSDDKFEHLKRYESHMYDTALYELPQNWNDREFVEIVEALRNLQYECNHEGVLVTHDIQLILCPLDNELLLDENISKPRKNQKQYQISKEQIEQMEESAFESLMAIANISQSSGSIDKKKCIPQVVKKSKQMTEKGFMGTFLQSKVPKKQASPLKQMEKSRGITGEIILIDTEETEADDQNVTIDVHRAEEDKLSFEIESQQNISKTIVVDISSDSSSNELNESPKEQNLDNSYEIQSDITQSTENSTTKKISEEPTKESSLESSSKRNLQNDSTGDLTIQPYYPHSCHDLSPRALDCTLTCSVQYENGNKGHIPHLVAESCSLEILNTQQVIQFINNARDTIYRPLKKKSPGTSPEMDKIVELLPEHARNVNYARHLFRNFVDSEDSLVEHGKETDPSFIDLNLSRREMDIILYCIENKHSHDICHTFMPYRELSGVQKLYDDIFCLAYHEIYSGYMKNVMNCVGIIVQLENYDTKVRKIRLLSSKKEWILINDLVKELSDLLSEFDIPRKFTIKPNLTIKVYDALISAGTNFDEGADWNVKKQEFLDMILANLLNGR